MASINNELVKIRQSATVALADKIRNLKAQGEKIFCLQTGDPNFPTHPEIIETSIKSMRAGSTHYSDSRGIIQLRYELSIKIKNEYNVEYNPETEILITNGGIHAYYCALSAIINPSAEVLVPDPAWMPHVNLVHKLGGTPIRINSYIKNNFWPTQEEIVSKITSKTIAIVINSPNNPTGTIAEYEYLKTLVSIAEQYNLWVISDEVYESIVFDKKNHICFASIKKAKQRSIIINSFSKTYSMTGWRIGYLCAPKNIINQALKASQYTVTNVAPFIQEAAITALTNPAVSKSISDIKTIYEKRRNNVFNIFKSYTNIPIQLVRPDGTFYIFIDIRDLHKRSLDISQQLLREANVALVPGSVYGNNGEGFLRMTLAANEDEIQKGFTYFCDWITKKFL